VPNASGVNILVPSGLSKNMLNSHHRLSIAITSPFHNTLTDSVTVTILRDENCYKTSYQVFAESNNSGTFDLFLGDFAKLRKSDY
jgi:hypothetical protein